MLLLLLWPPGLLLLLLLLAAALLLMLPLGVLLAVLPALLAAAAVLLLLLFDPRPKPCRLLQSVFARQDKRSRGIKGPSEATYTLWKKFDIVRAHWEIWLVRSRVLLIAAAEGGQKGRGLSVSHWEASLLCFLSSACPASSSSFFFFCFFLTAVLFLSYMPCLFCYHPG